MMFQVKRCPECGKLYESGLYREKLGKPIVTCYACRTNFIDRSTNEWALRGIGSKLGYLTVTLFEVAITGVLSAMVLSLLVLLPDIVFNTHLSDIVMNNGGNSFIAMIVVCVIINLIRVIIRERRDYSASKLRMTDPHYRAMLQAAGLLKQ